VQAELLVHDCEAEGFDVAHSVSARSAPRWSKHLTIRERVPEPQPVLHEEKSEPSEAQVPNAVGLVEVAHFHEKVQPAVTSHEFVAVGLPPAMDAQ
jgi:hypothetical protein